MTCTPHTQPLQEARVATPAKPSWLKRAIQEAGKAACEGRLAGWGGGQGRVAGRVGWLAGSGSGPGGGPAGSGGGPGRMAGLAGWLAGWDGGLVGPKGMDLWIKECSGVNIVT